MNVKAMNTIKSRANANDRIYTPPQVADLMLKFCDYKEGQLVLECCSGNGDIYEKLKEPKEYCEIDEDRDFFDYCGFVDIIISSPPYSIIDAWLKHTYLLCDKFCYILGVYSLTPKRIEIMNKNDFYITKILLTKIPNWFQCSYIIVCERLQEKPNKIIFETVNLGNKCLYCGCSVGGTVGYKHCKRKASETVCKY